MLSFMETLTLPVLTYNVLSVMEALTLPVLTYVCLTVSYVNYDGFLCDRSSRVAGTLSCLCFTDPTKEKLCLQPYMRDNNFAVCRSTILDGIVSSTLHLC